MMIRRLRLHPAAPLGAVLVTAAAAALASCRTAPGPALLIPTPPADESADEPYPPLAPEPSVPDEAADPIVRRGILRRDHARIVDAGGRPVRLRGVAFGNQVWQRRAFPVQHHGQADFERVKAMGMNAVRFYLYFGTFEDNAKPFQYKAAGWQWLDRNVAWARRHGVYLILNMHVPAGGFQSGGEGRELWEVPANQDRLVALWRAIAARYAHEPIVAGYDLLNEPGVTRSKDQWRALAGRITKAIREVDRQHIIVVERLNSIAKSWNNDADMNFFVVDDPNVVYTFHFYEPFAYTHQFASWVPLGEGGRYPDEARLARAGDTKWINVAAFDSPKLPPGDSGWTRSVGPRLRATDPRAVIGHLSLVARRVGEGRAVFDDLVVEEWDERDRPLGPVMRLDLRHLGGWYFWSANKSGSAGGVADGHGGSGALTITGTTDDANLGSWQEEFAPRPGHSYAVSGWMRGERLPPEATVQIRLDFLGSDTPVSGRNKAFLRAQLERYLSWGRAHEVPLFLGEFGVHHPCFQDGRGGLAWVEDMLDLADDAGLSFTYHSYHEDAFGLYSGGGPVDPARANHELIALFTRKLTASR